MANNNTQPAPHHAAPHGQRIGQRLVEHGVLSDEQVQRILEAQGDSHHPFGHIAAEMFGTDERELWRAWARQIQPYLTPVRPGEIAPTPQALDYLPWAKAGRWSVLPLQIEEDGTLLCATSPRALPDAMAAMQMNADRAARFVLVAENALVRWINSAYATIDAEAA